MLDVEQEEGAAMPPPILGFQWTVDPKQQQYAQFMQDLKTLITTTGARIVDGAIVVGSLKLIVEDNLFIKSHQEVMIKSGCDRRSDGRVNSIHINPNLDANDKVIHRHVPFSQQRARPHTKRPKRGGCGCGCKHS